MNTNSEKLRRLNSAISLINGIYHEISNKLGISDSVMTVLYTLSYMNGSCLLRDIYTSWGIPKQTINSSVRKLENKGILVLEKISGKSKKVILTEKGKDYADKTVGQLIIAENKILEQWSEDDANMYIILNHRYANDLKAASEHISEDIE